MGMVTEKMVGNSEGDVVHIWLDADIKNANI